MKKYGEDNRNKIKLRKAKRYLENKDVISKKRKEEYKLKPKIRKTNHPTDLTILERKIRKNARAYARKKPLKHSCQICKNTNNLIRHHWRYDKPLMFSTLCNECHKIQHIKDFNGGLHNRN